MVHLPHSTPRLEQGFVLAGGASSRMGQTKAFLELGGKSLLARAISCLEPSTVQVAVIGLQPLSYGKVICLPDLVSGQGPLSGILTGLTLTKSDPVSFCPCDCPFLPASIYALLLRHLEDAWLSVPVDGSGQVHPLIGVYRHECLEILRTRLASGRFAVMGMLDELGARARLLDVAQFGVPDHVFLNVNTPESLEEARGRLKR